MLDYEAVNLSARISNCLQTILDLEPDIERLKMGHVLVREFEVLKSFLAGLEQLEVDEGDVERIESATRSFLRELETPLALTELERVKKHLVQ